MQKLSNQELQRPDTDTYQQLPKIGLTLILDNVRSALNVGSVFRTADAFRILRIILCGITATPPHREIQKTALGATESVSWEYASSALESVHQLKNEGYEVYALEQVRGSIPLHRFHPQTSTIAIVLGHEMEGVQQAVVDACNGAIEIVQEGTKHSLNVAVCAGIVCYDLHKKMTHL